MTPGRAKRTKISTGGKLLLLELGVGFNTPAIIRWPFERITAQRPHAALIRINLDDSRVPGEIAAKSIGFQADIAQVMQSLVDRYPGIPAKLPCRSQFH
jgi:hypothetical protein